MAVTPDRTAASASEAAAHRRWLITLVITVLFGGFGALMAYLSYANSSKPAASSPRRSRPSTTSPSTATTTAPTTAPTAAPDVTPPAAAPSSDEGDTGKPDKRKPHEDR